MAIGRALAARPGLILADEPTGNLDETTGDAVLALLLELVAASGASLLLVTHSPRLAARADARTTLRAGTPDMSAVLAALLGHWRRHPLELATLLVGLAVATALWSGVQALNAEARESYARAAALLGADRLAQVVPADGRPIALADYVALRRAGWKVSPVLEGDLRRGGDSLRIVGIDPSPCPAGALGRAGTAAERLNAFVLPPHQALAAPETAAPPRGRPRPAAAGA